MTLKNTDKLIELIDDDIASLDMTTEGYYACLCTLQMVKLYIEALPTVPLDWKSILDDWTEHDNAMIAKGREIERRLNAPKRGRWIKDGDTYSLYKCSACNEFCTGAGWANCIPEEQMYKGFKYCPNCGARMIDEVDNG